MRTRSPQYLIPFFLIGAIGLIGILTSFEAPKQKLREVEALVRGKVLEKKGGEFPDKRVSDWMRQRPFLQSVTTAHGTVLLIRSDDSSFGNVSKETVLRGAGHSDVSVQWTNDSFEGLGNGCERGALAQQAGKWRGALDTRFTCLTVTSGMAI